MKRRNLLAGLGASLVAGCSKVGDSQPMQKLFDWAEGWHRGAQRTLGGRNALAREFSSADISPYLRGNGTTDPDDAGYATHSAAGFVDWTLAVGGLVERPLVLSLEQVRALPQRTQITRHDCVEGWSCIAKWKGPQLGPILDQAGVKPEAKYCLYHCYDTMDDGLGGSVPYYETSDLIDAHHPQTILAYSMNDMDLPIANGAPVRVRIERALGYKQAKYVHTVELVSSFANVGDGKGGYWEDNGYDWYAGI